MPFYVYMLHCADGSFSTGHTDNLERRIQQHRTGELGGYTAGRRPVRLVFDQEVATREEARSLERQVKRWSRAKKAALVAGNWRAIRRLAERRSPDTRWP